MSPPVLDRLDLTRAHFVRRVEQLRVLLAACGLDPRLAIAVNRRVAALEQAARDREREAGRDGWLRAAAAYRVDPITALVDFENSRDLVVAQQQEETSPL